MAIDFDTARPGDCVWVLAHGWWRRGEVLARLRKRVIIVYVLQDGTRKETRRAPEGFDVQTYDFEPRPNDLAELIERDERPCYSDRPIARSALWEPDPNTGEPRRTKR